MKSKAFALSAVLLLAACGDSHVSTPTQPSEPVPNIAGSYSTQWLTQFIRPHDGYSGSWTCAGNLTIVQSPGASSFTGFGVVNAPCPAVSFDLAGKVQVGGAISFDTGGPKAGAGPCPAPPDVGAQHQDPELPRGRRRRVRLHTDRDRVQELLRKRHPVVWPAATAAREGEFISPQRAGGLGGAPLAPPSSMTLL